MIALKRNFVNYSISGYKEIILCCCSFSDSCLLYKGISSNSLLSILSRMEEVTLPITEITRFLLIHLKLRVWIPVFEEKPSEGVASIISGNPFPYFFELHGTINIESLVWARTIAGWVKEGSCPKLQEPKSIIKWFLSYSQWYYFLNGGWQASGLHNLSNVPFHKSKDCVRNLKS